MNEIKQNADNIILESMNDFKIRKRRFNNVSMIFNVLSFGIIPLHAKLKQIIANQLAESSGMSGSGYKYWNKNYFAVIDSMDDKVKACNRLEKIEKKILKQLNYKSNRQKTK